MNNDVICVIGPTAVGKTDFSIKLAQHISAEIINADSMQIYKYMDIGTAKPTREEMGKIKHHLIDIIEPDEEFNVKQFVELATLKVNELKCNGKKAILCGGTGLYIKALLNGIFDAPSGDKIVRKKIEDQIQQQGIDSVYERLKKIDPKSTDRIHKNDYKRIIRALEVYEITGKPITQMQEEQRKAYKPPFEMKLIGLTSDRDNVYGRVDRRCDKMIELGFVEEVQSLRDKGYGRDLQSMQAIGYSHINHYIDHEYDYDEMVRLIKRDTRRFAKRQWTLFNSLTNVEWIEYNPNEDFNF